MISFLPAEPDSVRTTVTGLHNLSVQQHCLFPIEEGTRAAATVKKAAGVEDIVVTFEDQQKINKINRNTPDQGAKKRN